MDKQLLAAIAIGLMLACAMSHPANPLGLRKFALLAWSGMLILPVVLLLLGSEILPSLTTEFGHLWLISSYLLLFVVSLAAKSGFSLWRYFVAKSGGHKAAFRAALSDDQVALLHLWRPVIVDGQPDADAVVEMRIRRSWASWLEAVGGVMAAAAFIPVFSAWPFGVSLSLLGVGAAVVAAGIFWDYRARLRFGQTEKVS